MLIFTRHNSPLSSIKAQEYALIQGLRFGVQTVGSRVGLLLRGLGFRGPFQGSLMGPVGFRV